MEIQAKHKIIYAKLLKCWWQNEENKWLCQIPGQHSATAAQVFPHIFLGQSKHLLALSMVNKTLQHKAVAQIKFTF